MQHLGITHNFRRPLGIAYRSFSIVLCFPVHTLKFNAMNMFKHTPQAFAFPRSFVGVAERDEGAWCHMSGLRCSRAFATWV